MQRQLVPFAASEIDQRITIRILAVARALHLDDCANVAAGRANWQRLQGRIVLAGISSSGACSVLERSRFQVRRHPVWLRNTNSYCSTEKRKSY